MTLFELMGLVSVDTAGAEASLRNVDTLAGRVGSTLQSVARHTLVTSMAFGLYNQVSNVVNTVKDAMIGFNAQMEQSSIGLTTLVGSAEGANEMLTNLMDFAAKTPFEFPELLQATNKMKALGFATEEVLPSLKVLGDASSALGTGTFGVQRMVLALGQMRLKGKVTGEEMRQLVEAGVNGWKYLADATGKTTAEVQALSKKGLIPAKEAVDVILAGMEKDFPDMMKNLADTWQGLTSTIKDNIRITLGNITSGVFNSMKEVLKVIRDFTTDVNDVFKEGGMESVWLTFVPDGVRERLDPFFQFLKDNATTLQETFQSIAPVIGSVIGDIAGFINEIILPVLSLFFTALKDIAGYIGENWSTLAPIVKSVAIAFTSYQGARTAIMLLNNAMVTLRKTMLVTAFISNYHNALMALGPMAGSLTGTFVKLKAGMTALGATMVKTVLPIILTTALFATITFAIVEVARNFDLFKVMWGDTWQVVGAFADRYCKGVMVTFNWFKVGLTKFFSAVETTIYDFSSWTSGILAGIGEALGIEKLQKWADANKKASEANKRFSEMSVADAERGYAESVNKMDSATKKVDASMKDLRKSAGAFWKAVSEDGKQAWDKVFGTAYSDAEKLRRKTEEATAKNSGYEPDDPKRTPKKEDDKQAEYTKPLLTPEQANKALNDAMKAKQNGKDKEKAEKERAKAIANMWSSTAQQIKNAFSSIASVQGTGTKKAKDQLTAVFKDLQAMASVAKKYGFGDQLYKEITSAMKLIEGTVDDTTGEVAKTLLNKLAGTSKIVAGKIKDDNGQASRDFQSAWQLAIDTVIENVDAYQQKLEESNLKSAQKLYDAIANAIKKQVTAEKQASEDRIKLAQKTENERLKAVKDGLEEEKRAKIEVIQAEIDALNSKREAEDRQADEHKAYVKRRELEIQLSEAKTAKERWDIQQQLAEAINDRNRELVEQEIEDKIEGYEKDKQGVEDTYDLKISKAEEASQKVIDTLEKELDYLSNTYYPALLEESRVNALAQKMMVEGNINEIGRLLLKYGTDLNDLGLDFSDAIGKGLDQLLGKDIGTEVGKQVEESKPFLLSMRSLLMNMSQQDLGTPLGKSLKKAEPFIEALINDLELGKPIGEDALKAKPYILDVIKMLSATDPESPMARVLNDYAPQLKMTFESVNALNIGAKFGSNLVDGAKPFVKQLSDMIEEVLNKIALAKIDLGNLNSTTPPANNNTAGTGSSSGLSTQDAYLLAIAKAGLDLPKGYTTPPPPPDTTVITTPNTDTRPPATDPRDTGDVTISITPPPPTTTPTPTTPTTPTVPVTTPSEPPPTDPRKMGFTYYHSGGLVGGLGTSIFETLKDLLSLKINEVPAILEEDEFVIPKGLAGALGNLNLASLRQPELALGGSVTNISGAPTYMIDVHDNSFTDGRDAGNKILNALKRRNV